MVTKKTKRPDLRGIWKRIEQAFHRSRAIDNPSQMAALLDVTRHSVYKWRNGKNPPELATLIRISEETNSSLHWLLTGQGPSEVIQDPSIRIQVGRPIEVLLSKSLCRQIEEEAADEGRTVEDVLAQLVAAGARERITEKAKMAKMEAAAERVIRRREREMGRGVKSADKETMMSDQPGVDRGRQSGESRKDRKAKGRKKDGTTRR